MKVFLHRSLRSLGFGPNELVLLKIPRDNSPLLIHHHSCKAKQIQLKIQRTNSLLPFHHHFLKLKSRPTESKGIAIEAEQGVPVLSKSTFLTNLDKGKNEMMNPLKIPSDTVLKMSMKIKYTNWCRE